MASLPRISIVIVYWNAPDHLARLLEQLRKQKADEVLVLINASPENTWQRILRDYPDFRVIYLQRNLGYAGALAEGLRLAAHDWVLFLNPDISLPDGFLQALREAAHEHADHTGLSATVVEQGTPDADGSTWNLALRRVRRVFRDPYRSLAPAGACMLLRRSDRRLWDALPPNDWFLYYEDVLLGLRLRLQGAKLRKLPLRCVHLAGGSVSRWSPYLRRYWIERNRVRLLHYLLGRYFWRAAFWWFPDLLGRLLADLREGTPGASLLGFLAGVRRRLPGSAPQEILSNYITARLPGPLPLQRIGIRMAEILGIPTCDFSEHSHPIL